jgi:PPOX class probable FMN-dependent enzyme
MAYAEIGSVKELRDLLGVAKGRATTKERTRLHPMDRTWLATSPFCVVATCDADGNCDASPKGDPAGELVHVLDDTTVAIPERPGNRRADGFLNVLANPHAGIISIIPGRSETLRINGRARILRDAPFFDDMVVRGNRPLLALLIEIDQIFFHCAKAFMRSQLWEPETWLEAYYDPVNYSKRLYCRQEDLLLACRGQTVQEKISRDHELRRCRQAATRARFWQVTEQKRRWPAGEASMNASAQRRPVQIPRRAGSCSASW